MNRQQRRHKTHSLLPIQYPSKRGVYSGKRIKIDNEGYNLKEKIKKGNNRNR